MNWLIGWNRPPNGGSEHISLQHVSLSHGEMLYHILIVNHTRAKKPAEFSRDRQPITIRGHNAARSLGQSRIGCPSEQSCHQKL